LHSLPFITLKNVTLRIRDRWILANTNWVLKTHQHWAILGPNGSGKTSLAGALTGEVPVVRGRIIRHYSSTTANSISYLSFELHRRLIAKEEGMDAARFFSGDLSSATTAQETILADDTRHGEILKRFDQIVNRLEIGNLLQRGIRTLSTGEMRKVLIARALLKSPRVLILDEPFDGLDNLARLWLADSIKALMKIGVQVILVTHRVAEIVPGISHILLLKDGRVIAQGKRKDMLYSYFKEGDALNNSQVSNRVAELEKSTPSAPSIPPDQPQIVVMRNVTVKYGQQNTLSGLNWTMKQGQNWAIIGPNGAGKTTLLDLIFGDNPQAYANEIYLFGRRRGSGESIWSIKQRIGFISPEFQIRYRKQMRVLDVVVSGFYDSVGLYRMADPEKMKIAKQWIKLFGIENLIAENFEQLSYGEQRMVLLARAVVKSPLLLILDEPCQGLDSANRKKMLGLFDLIGRTGRTQLIYVTHYSEEIPECITHVLQFEKKPQGGFITFTKPFSPKHLGA